MQKLNCANHHMVAEWDQDWFGVTGSFFCNSNLLIMESVLKPSDTPDSRWLSVSLRVCITPFWVVQGPVSGGQTVISGRPMHSVHFGIFSLFNFNVIDAFNMNEYRIKKKTDWKK